ncbi:extracellular lipase [Penicillium riverlandense]|uniref:extracellular lipase n=1 Tax=Penicillium riverlandense TaxID=1903569 RepID=UPI002548A544|nr:extracellular lipase [Penicillium riverlandense]KAJ5818482.1 extracellular lipase [Penicillium riverlandense]
MRRSFLSALAFASAVLALSPTITLSHPEATIIGIPGEVESFNAIPFAQQPVGNLRLRAPMPLEEPLGTIEATGISKSCPNFWLTTGAHVLDGSQNPLEAILNDLVDLPLDIVGEILTSPFFNVATNTAEDCLSLNIRRPAGTTKDSKLPVLFWIHGGGFEWGAAYQYEGTPLVLDSINMDMPFIYVAIGYRLGGFGFLAGKEVKEAGVSNLGLLDQRMAMQWVADNIADFGGDPDKVTIWGESAGAISVFDQMAMFDGDNTYKGKPLFRAAMMDSGSVIPMEPVDSEKNQGLYDTVVDNAGCSGAKDTLECLRQAPFETFYNAANSVPNLFTYYSIDLSYMPRPDGKILTDSPDVLVKEGKTAKVPFIIGDQEDEGTLFALFQPNLTSQEDMIDYMAHVWRRASREDLQEFVKTYPDDLAAGSPYYTGILWNIWPKFKRMASMLGDIVFILQRRLLLDTAQVPCWTFISSYDRGTPILGTFHISDIIQVFYGVLPNYASKAFHTYYYSFIYDMNPNSRRGNLPEWPQYSEGHKALNMFAGESKLIVDDFRNESYSVLLDHIDTFRW